MGLVGVVGVEVLAASTIDELVAAVVLVPTLGFQLLAAARVTHALVAHATRVGRTAAALKRDPQNLVLERATLGSATLTGGGQAISPDASVLPRLGDDELLLEGVTEKLCTTSENHCNEQPRQQPPRRSQ